MAAEMEQPSGTGPAELAQFWKEVPRNKVMEHRSAFYPQAFKWGGKAQKKTCAYVGEAGMTSSVWQPLRHPVWTLSSVRLWGCPGERDLEFLEMLANSRHSLSGQSQECGCVSTQILSDNFSVITDGKNVISQPVKVPVIRD